MTYCEYWCPEDEQWIPMWLWDEHFCLAPENHSRIYEEERE